MFKNKQKISKNIYDLTPVNPPFMNLDMWYILTTNISHVSNIYSIA